ASIIIAILGLMLQGCGSSSSDKTQLRIAWWGASEHHKRYAKVIDKFEEKHPDVEIIPEYTGWDGYYEKLATKATSGALPDLIQMDYDYMEKYTSDGLLK